MPNLREIRRRIKSVKNTRQITKAMELVAASKMKKAQQSALSGQPYAALLAETLSHISTRIEELEHPFFEEREVKTRGIILVTTNRGLCGPLNSNLFRETIRSKTPMKFVSVGRKGKQVRSFFVASCADFAYFFFFFKLTKPTSSVKTAPSSPRACAFRSLLSYSQSSTPRISFSLSDKTSFGCSSTGSRTRSRCVFCFHCINVSSNSIYPLASSMPITLLCIGKGTRGI